ETQLTEVIDQLARVTSQTHAQQKAIDELQAAHIKAAAPTAWAKVQAAKEAQEQPKTFRPGQRVYVSGRGHTEGVGTVSADREFLRIKIADDSFLVAKDDGDAIVRQDFLRDAEQHTDDWKAKAEMFHQDRQELEVANADLRRQNKQLVESLNAMRERSA